MTKAKDQYGHEVFIPSDNESVAVYEFDTLIMLANSVISVTSLFDGNIHIIFDNGSFAEFNGKYYQVEIIEDVKLWK